MLFSDALISDLLPDQERQIKDKVQRLPPNYLLNVSEEDLVVSLTGEYTLDVPVLDEAGIHLDYGEQQIDGSRDPMRYISDTGTPFYISGTRVTFIIPFSGDSQLLGVRPQHFAYHLRGSDVAIKGQEIHVTYAGANLNFAGAKQEFDSELGQIQQNLGNLSTAINRHNSSISQIILTIIQQRKSKLLADASMAASIGYPIKRRDGVAATYSVPVQKRRPKIERPAAPSGSFQPEPVLAITEYDEILNIVRNMVQVMERSPKAFEGMGEEDLRTHFLVQLNGQYEGRATGETFNFQGKTDILIRDQGKNIFIAECKFWGGEKQFIDTIDQVLSYLSWRDTKVAVLIFSRNAQFSEVLKRFVAKSDESSFRYVFHQPSDMNRELTLTVMAFDMPKQRDAGASAGS
jgi:hypothetical protein